MSTTVDNRVVEMQFDNKEFEKGVKQTMNSLDELKKKLEFKNVHAGTDELEKSFYSMSGIVQTMQNDVAKLTSAFTGLWGTLRRHTVDKIAAEIEGGMRRIYNAVGGEGIRSGKSKYELKLDSMRTIMIATEKSAEEVEKVLDDLSWYSDQTSYNFSEMVSYISNFTSYGIDLEVAEKAMEGIANASARVGVKTSEAGRAMREFAQAMGAGQMESINFKTLETMGFADKRFKEEVIAAAIELGKLGKNGELLLKKGVDKGKIVDIKNFRDMLKYGFMDEEVMLKVLQKYADTSEEFGEKAFKAAQEAKTFTDAIEAIKDAISSGWSKSFELIFGNIDEAAKFFTDFCNTIIDDFVSPMNDARNAILVGWKEGGGRDTMIAALDNIWQLLKDVGRAAKDAFTSVFGELTSDKLIKATEAVRNFIGQIRVWLYTTSGNGRMRITNITNAIRGFLGVIKIAKTVIGGVFHFIGRILSMLSPAFDSFGDFLGDTGSSIAEFADELEKNGTITKFFDNVADHIKPFIEWIKNLYKTVTTSPIFQTIRSWLSNFVKDIPGYWEKVQGFFSDIWSKITSSPIFKNLSAKFQEFTSKLPEMWENVKKWFSTAWEKGGGTIGGFFSEIGKRIAEGFKNFISDLPNKFAKLKTKIAEVGSNIGGWFADIWSKISGKFSGVSSGVMLSLSATWERIRNWFTETFSGIGAFFRNLFGGTQKEVVSAATGSSSGSGATSNPVEEVVKATEKGKGPFGFLEDIGKFFENLVSNWKKNFSTRLLVYLSIIGLLFWKVAMVARNVRKSIEAITFAKNVENKKGGFLRAMLGIAAVVASIAGMLYVVNQIPVENFDKLMVLLGVVFGAILAISFYATMNSNNAAKIGIFFIGMGVAFAGIGAGLLMMSEAIKSLSGGTWSDFFRGFSRLVAVVATIGVIYAVIGAIISKYGGSGGNLSAGKAIRDVIGIGVGILAISVAIKMLIPVIKEFGDMDLKKLAQGVGGVAVLLIAFGVAMAGLGKVVEGGSFWETLVAFIGGIIIVKSLVKAIEAFSDVPFDKTIAICAGLFAIFGGLALMFLAMSKLQDIGGKGLLAVLVSSLAIIGVAAAIVFAVIELKNQPLEQCIAILGGIAAIMLLSSVFIKIASGINAAGAKNIVVVMAAVAVGMVAIGAAAAAIVAIGSSVVGIFASALGSLAGGLATFNEMTGSVTTERMAEMVAIVEIFMEKFIEMSGLDYRSVRDFSSNLNRLGVSMMTYNNRTSSANWNTITKSYKFIENLIKLSKKTQNVKKMNLLSDVIADIGAAIRLYYLSISDIDAGNAPSGKSVDISGISSMIEQLANALPDDKLVEKVAGYTNDENGLTKLALGLTEIGVALKDLSGSIDDVSMPNITFALEALNGVKTLASEMPEDAELVTAFGTLHSHKTTLDNFATDIESLAGALTSLATCFGENSGEGKTNVTDAITAIQNLAGIYKDMTDNDAVGLFQGLDSLLGAVANEVEWGGFIGSLGTLGTQFKAMVDKLAETNFEGFTETELATFTAILSSIAKLYNTVSGGDESSVGYTIEQIRDAALNLAGFKTTIFGAITDLSKTLFNGIRWSWFVSSLGNVGSGIGKLVDALYQDDSSFKELTAEDASIIGTVMSSIVNLYNGVVGEGEGDPITKFGEAASGIILAATNPALMVVDDLLGTFAEAGLWWSFVESIPELARGMNSLISALSETSMLTVSSNTEKKFEILTKISEFLVGLYNGIKELPDGEIRVTVFPGITSMLTACADNIRWDAFEKSIPSLAGGMTGLIAVLSTVNTSNLEGDNNEKLATITKVAGFAVDLYNAVDSSPDASSIKPGLFSGLGQIFEAVNKSMNWDTFVKYLPDLGKNIGKVINALNDPGVDVSGIDDHKLEVFRAVMEGLGFVAKMGEVLTAYKNVSSDWIGNAINAFTSFVSAWSDDKNGKSLAGALEDLIGGNSPLLRFLSKVDEYAITERGELLLNTIQAVYGILDMAYEFTQQGENGENVYKWANFNLADLKGVLGSFFEFLNDLIQSEIFSGTVFTAAEQGFQNIVSFLNSLNGILQVLDRSHGFNYLFSGEGYSFEAFEETSFYKILRGILTFATTAVSEIDSVYGSETGVMTKVINLINLINSLRMVLSDAFTGQWESVAATSDSHVKIDAYYAVLKELKENLLPYIDENFNDQTLLSKANFVSMLLDNLSSTLSSAKNLNVGDADFSMFTAVSEGIVGGINDGIVAGEESIASVGKSIVDILSSAIGSYGTTQMRIIGQNLDAGMERGIRNYASLPKAAMISTMNAVIKIARTIPLVESPSRVMAEIGMYLMAGLEQGMHDEGGKSVDEMEGIMTRLLNVAEWVAPSIADGVLSQKEQFAQAMAELGIAGEEALRDTLQIHSISPLFWGIGEWVPVSLARGASSKPRALTEAGEAMGELLERSVREGVAVFADGKWLEDFGHMSQSEMQAYAEAYPEMMGYLLKQYARNRREQGDPLFNFAKAVGTASSQWANLQNTLSGFGINVDLSGLDEIELGPSIATELGKSLGLSDAQIEWLSDKFEGTSAANLLKIFTGGGVNGWDLSGLQNALLHGDSLSNVMEALGMDGIFGTLLGRGLDVLENGASQINTPGSNNGANGNGNGAGGSGGAYGTNGVNTTPGGLKLTSTDGYTIGDIVNRIDRLENAITSMQIVLDSGALVGSMGRAMDRQLGDYVMYAGRRN